MKVFIAITAVIAAIALGMHALGMAADAQLRIDNDSNWNIKCNQ